MDSNAVTVSPAENEVSLARLYILRAMYLLLVIGGAIMFLPQLIHHEPTARGVIPSMLGAMWVLACFGLRYPLQMLPILLFEQLWKTIWLVDYGLPQRMAGVNSTQFREDFQAIAIFPVILIAILPWGYIFRHYVKKPGARWR
jgi:hypothetical protein